MIVAQEVQEEAGLAAFPSESHAGLLTSRTVRF